MDRRRREWRHDMTSAAREDLPTCGEPPKSRPAELRRGPPPHQPPLLRTLLSVSLWMAFRANLGTLMRTCDAVGACVAVLDTDFYRESLQHGDTLRSRRPCIHWIRDTAATTGFRHNAIPAGVWSRSNSPREPCRCRACGRSTSQRSCSGSRAPGSTGRMGGGCYVCVEIPMHWSRGQPERRRRRSLVLYRLSGLG